MENREFGAEQDDKNASFREINTRTYHLAGMKTLEKKFNGWNPGKYIILTLETIVVNHVDFTNQPSYWI